MSRYHVELDKDLEDLVPIFLENRHKELGELRAALQQGDMTGIGKIGHNLKGVAGSYGFLELAQLGAQLQEEAGRQDLVSLHATVHLIDDYLSCVQIIFNDMQ
jgi:HPt (histidine-containing phosphotransfer) domain-containing protein